MAVQEVTHRPEHGRYRAIIGTDEAGWFGGQVRIEPPFSPGKWLRDYAEGERLNLEHVATTEHGTLFTYNFADFQPDSDGTYKALVAEHIGTLLEFVGRADSEGLFVKNWEQYNIQ